MSTCAMILMAGSDAVVPRGGEPASAGRAERRRNPGRLERPGGRRGPRLDAELAEDPLEVLRDGRRTNSEDPRGIVVRFSPRDPGQDLRFAPGQPEPGQPDRRDVPYAL